ncbi:cystathionine gamma-synthase/methionine-gamma-lyase [Thermosporothrix hazakensis]|jgi:cystathionine gamma-synthase/methionine-gamma-lyase|uniref:homocysteine desulfhydrase n=2 Tax=Thermosporothrix TaxID=768650 RepID=A0A326U8U3_THEHA|nr:PLP-dependent aspartate aminotransferase family protein [Thermosporothrix hazakensis]PZW30472.1 cystathionine gamma-synthase/methionine-gamma-lyase [Thermosporothrix hazakensis]BBH91187.1 cystathionine beta-lyase [Thermosporothrix sp. COM3]GCE49332.1 cystathionine beta-lyase [Thermosporothrix hazakensis]
MTNKKDWDLETLLIHSGRTTLSALPTGTPTVQPIHASTTYLYDSVEALDKAFEGTTPEGEPAFVYARHGNPSTNTFEEAMTTAEGGAGAVSFGSGMAAIHAAILAAGVAPGAKILASKDLYGATIGLFQKVFAPQGVTIVLKDLCTPDVAEVIEEEEPDIIFVETISNPLVKLVDLDAISTASRAIGAVTIVDSTFTTPYLVRPIEHGFDLVVHSTTKYIGGHGDSTGGIVVSATNALLSQVRNYAIILGAILSPFETHLMTRGLRTLALRMERQSQNAARIAEFLQQHPAVAHVYYPGLSEHPHHELANRLLRPGLYGGLLSFDLKEQTREAAFRFMDSLQLCLPATTLGDVFTLVTYPPISSHRTQTKRELQELGISEGCIRLSAGIEHCDDILQDLEQALG